MVEGAPEEVPQTKPRAEKPLFVGFVGADAGHIPMAKLASIETKSLTRSIKPDAAYKDYRLGSRIGFVFLFHTEDC